MYARILFGASAIVFGVAMFMAPGSDMWQRLQPLHGFSTIAAWCLVVAEIAGGIAMMLPRAARAASLTLGCVHGIYVLSCADSIVAAPGQPGGYIDGFEQLAIVCGAIAIYASTESDAARAIALGRVARLALGACAVSFAWAQVIYLQYTASLVPAWVPPNQVFWTNFTTGAFALAAIAMFVNRRARLAMRLLAVMIALFGVVVWVPMIAAHPATLSNWSEIGANYLIASAAWLVAAKGGPLPIGW
jgi:uncharacterized membrane protein YphA (DoxX/SURF4 family)